MLKKIIAAACLLLSASVYANPKTGEVIITEIQAWKDGFIIVDTDKPIINPANCSISNHMYELSNAYNTNTFGQSLLLTAFTTKEPLNLTIYAGGCGNSGRPLLVAIHAKN